MSKAGPVAGLSYPGDPGYDAATRVFNLSGPARPAVAITAGSPDDVRSAVRYASAHGLRVRAHTTGHAAGAVRPITDGLLITTRLAGGVEVDADARVARIGAGTPWSAVVEACAGHGLVAPHGSAATVGAVGYLLRGGLSFYGRHAGLAANSVRALDIVLADGELRRVDATTDAELFWAVRGGGGGFGVVTAVEVALFAAQEVVTGAAYWPGEYTEQVLPTWLRWTREAPRAVTTSLRIMNLPAVPDVPAVLGGRTTVAIDGAVLVPGHDRDTASRWADELLGPLRAIAPPVIDTWQHAAPSAVLGIHLDPTDPLPIVGDHMLLGDLDDDAAARLLRVTGPGSGSPLVVAGLRQLGGAYADADPTGGVLNHLDASLSYAGSGGAFDSGLETAIRDHCDVVRAALGPVDTGRTVPSFVERYDQPQGHLSAEEVARVDQVRGRVDPDGLFRDDISPGCTARYN